MKRAKLFTAIEDLTRGDRLTYGIMVSQHLHEIEEGITQYISMLEEVVTK